MLQGMVHANQYFGCRNVTVVRVPYAACKRPEGWRAFLTVEPNKYLLLLKSGRMT